MDILLMKCLHQLQWRHNYHDGVLNHQPHGCLLKRFFRHRSKKTSKLRVTGLCVGNSPGPVNSPHKGPVTRKMFPFDDVIMLDVHWQLVSVFVNSTIITVWNKVLYITCNISQKANIRLGADIYSAVDNIHQIGNIKNNSEYDTCKKAVHWRNTIITQDHTTQNGSRHSCSSVRICPVL